MVQVTQLAVDPTVALTENEENTPKGFEFIRGELNQKCLRCMWFTFATVQIVQKQTVT